MTAHRAALPVTTEVSGVTRVGFRTAGTLPGVRPVSHLLPSPSQPSPHQAGDARRLPQPTATCLLGPRPESVKTGRDFTRATLVGWDMPALADVAELVVSELVTNALRHGVPSACQLVSEHCVRLRLLAQAPFMMCMVTDPGADIPVLRESGPTSESGRGLNVVECCSVRWGWHLLDDGGKVVWALLRPPF
jgi:histidine kinase-like protein